MPNVVVGTVTAVHIPVPAGAPAVIQNLGPGIIYVDGSSTVTTGTGVKVAVDAIVTLTSSQSVGNLYAISDTATTNVRYLA